MSKTAPSSCVMFRFVRKSTILCAALACILVPGVTRADVVLGGYVKSFVFEQVTDPYALERAGSRLQLSARGGQGPVSFYTATDFELDSRMLLTDQPATRGEGFDVYPVEAYVNLSAGPVDIRAGQQFIFWGRTTWVNPTDVITPWNYPDMASEIEDYRIAPFATRVNWYIAGELMADLVWVPIFRPTRLGPFGPTSVNGLPVIQGPPDLPERTLENGEFGFRLSHSISRWALDWSVSAYKGWEKMPTMSLTPNFPTSTDAGDDTSDGPPPGVAGTGEDDGAMPMMPESFTQTNHYGPLLMVGADFAKAVGPFVIKGEGAYKRTGDEDGTDIYLRNSRIESVVGLDYVLSENVTLGTQYINTYLLDYDQEAELAAHQAMGSNPEFLEAAFAQELSLTANITIIPQLGCQFTGLYNLTYQDFFVLGFVWWELADALKLYAGAVGFGGADATTPFGALTDASRAFVELKYSF